MKAIFGLQPPQGRAIMPLRLNLARAASRAQMSDRPPTLVLHVAIEPKTTADREKLGLGLSTLMAEDQLLRAKTDERTGHVVVAGVDELHLEILIDRLRREFEVEAGIGRLQVAYKETLTRPAEGEMKYARQTGGRGQYGHVKLHVFPAERGAGYGFESEIVGGAIPEEFIQSIDDGIRNALAHGVLAGYSIDDVRVVLYDGSYHRADSSPMAFELAGAMAFLEAAKKAKPVLLEPVMRVEVAVPRDYLDDVMSDIVGRRGRMQSHEDLFGTQIISARVPLSEMIGYATDLRSRTRGAATYSMEFDRYEARNFEDGDEAESTIGAPHRPRPPLRSSAVALPEPESAE